MLSEDMYRTTGIAALLTRALRGLPSRHGAFDGQDPIGCKQRAFFA
jgi:hypothetical protein